jgi:hypothetical protein
MEGIPMKVADDQVRVAVNVMRARLTVIGFNIAIVSFQIANLYKSSGGIRVPGVDHAVHVGPSMALFMALGLSLIALVAYIISSAFDEVGYCTHWSLVAGDLLMYLGLAHTLAGFFAPLSTSIEIFAAQLPDQASSIYILHMAAMITGGVGWFLATYAGPVVSLLRSPFDRRVNMALGVAYLALLLVLSWVSAQSARVGTFGAGGEQGVIIGILGDLVQPFRW